MTKNRQLRTGLCLVLIALCTLLSKPVFADDRSQEKLIRLYANEAFGPIGKVYSLGGFVIDGRLTHGEQTIWGGELIQTVASSSLSVNIDGVGRITLRNSAMARLATPLTRRDDDTERHTFVASLINGDMAVRLNHDAGAFIESGRTAFTSSLGANFVISAREGSAAIEVVSGKIKAEPQPADLRFTGSTVQLKNGIPVPVPGADTINTNTKKKVRIVIQFTKVALKTKTSSVTNAFSPRYVSFRSQATQLEVPAAGRRVQLSVDPAVGLIVPTEAVTDSNGVVQADFIAGSNEATGTITARVLRDPGDPDRTEYKLYERRVIVRKLPLWRTRNLLIGAAAIAAIIVIVDPETKPIQQQPPPVVIP